uniref:EF-hand domain-containing protein n=1 Tax=Oryza glumipatula TaxID=40148 RepID=A0A0D9Z8H0_9ORYZ
MVLPSITLKIPAMRCRAIISSPPPMTLEEFKKWFMKFDTNNDGRISGAELREAIRSKGFGFSAWWKSIVALHQADKDRNGYIDEFEIENLVTFAQKVLGIKITTWQQHLDNVQKAVKGVLAVTSVSVLAVHFDNYNEEKLKLNPFMFFGQYFFIAYW